MLLLYHNGRAEYFCQRTYGPQSLKYLLPGSLQKKFKASSKKKHPPKGRYKHPPKRRPWDYLKVKRTEREPPLSTSESALKKNHRMFKPTNMWGQLMNSWDSIILLSLGDDVVGIRQNELYLCSYKYVFACLLPPIQKIYTLLYI